MLNEWDYSMKYYQTVVKSHTKCWDYKWFEAISIHKLCPQSLKQKSKKITFITTTKKKGF